VASMRDSVVRLPDGTIGLRLVERERSILRALLGDLREIVGAEADPPGLTELEETGDDEDANAAGEATAAADEDVADAESDDVELVDVLTDPVLIRLYPDARPDDPAWSARFRDMIRGDLDDARRENLAVVEDTLDARSIDDDQAEAWLHVLNDLRLAGSTMAGLWWGRGALVLFHDWVGTDSCPCRSTPASSSQFSRSSITACMGPA